MKESFLAPESDYGSKEILGKLKCMHETVKSLYFFSFRFAMYSGKCESRSGIPAYTRECRESPAYTRNSWRF